MTDPSKQSTAGDTGDTAASQRPDTQSALLLIPFLAGLSALSLVQPVLDIYGRNPSALSAAQLSRTGVGAFVLLVALAPLLVSWLTTVVVSKLSVRAGTLVRQGWTALFLGLFAAILARRIEFGTALSVIFIVGIASLGFIAVERSALARTFVRYLGILLPASAFLFVFNSPAGSILTEGEASVADANLRSDAPVLFAVFDELMIVPLLASDGSINEDRFPGFARLASNSTWFRDTTTTHVRSELAVPAIFTGSRPELGLQPFSWDYPESVFTLLGGTRPIDSFESFTSMCPASVCENTAAPTAQSDPRPGFSSFLSDVSIVYGHLSLPPVGRDRLPSIDSSWAGFGVTATSTTPASADERDASVDFDQNTKIAELLATGGPLGQLAELELMIDRLTNAEPSSSTVAVFHGLVPHRPYQATADGRRYNWRDGGDLTDADRRERYQAMMMQIVALDRVLNRSIQRLEDAGVWDDLLVVVVSDHGAVFESGFGPRKQLADTEGADTDYLNVPMFIKSPGQTEGVVSDCQASTIDIMPTIMDVLGLNVETSFDGINLFETCPNDRERLVGEVDGSEVSAEGGFGAILERVAFYDGWVDADGDVSDIAAIGESADLIGTAAPAVPESDQVAGWTITELGALFGLEPDPPEGSIVPAQFVGVVDVVAPLAAGTEGVIAINGVFGGVVVDLSKASSGEVAYTAMVDVGLLRDGPPTLELFIRAPDGGLTSAGAPVRP